MSLLSLQNVSKHFGSLVAVNEASFDIEDGEFVSILGPSGSGKSTILRMIAGFESPTEGTITLNGEDMVGVPPFEREVNMVFQDLALFPHLSVAENIGYGLKQRGIPEAEREERIEEALEMVHLEGYGDRDPGQLSGGEQQRVALVRALVNEPDIVLFDEPLASLDRKLRQHMQVELQRIQSETDITFLYVTHDQEVAMSVSDRMILLNDGDIEQIGTAEELYEDPASEFVATFIGDVNAIAGEVTNVSDDELTITARATEMTYNRDAVRGNGRRIDAGAEIDICVRPHAIQLTDAADGHSFAVNGTVRNRIYKGEDVSYIVETDIGSLTVDSNDESFDIGERVYATWSPDEVHLFPSGLQIEDQSQLEGGT